MKIETAACAHCHIHTPTDKPTCVHCRKNRAATFRTGVPGQMSFVFPANEVREPPKGEVIRDLAARA
jgi:hypothetical protein